MLVSSWIRAIAVSLAFGSAANAQFVDGFESYPASPAGTTFTPGGQTNSGGWHQFFAGDLVEDTKCFSTGGPIAPHGGTKYLGTQLQSDSVRTFTGFTSGRWLLRHWSYVPGPASSQPMLDLQWAVVLNDFNLWGPFRWAVQIRYDPLTAQVATDNGYSLTTCAPQWGVSLPLVFDAWAETVIDVDLDADVARLFYAGAPLGDPFAWSQGPFGNNGGSGLPCPPPQHPEKSIECLDLFANSTFAAPSFMYWDDISITSAAPVAYCTPTSGSSSGCSPAIAASDSPSTTHANACHVTVTDVEGDKSGIVFYGLAPHGAPWCGSGGGSLLCVKAPTMRTGATSTGGTAGACDGALTLDWNAFQLANPAALGAPWSAGDKAYVQGWFRDPPQCKTTFLTQALELTYVP